MKTQVTPMRTAMYHTVLVADFQAMNFTARECDGRTRGYVASVLASPDAGTIPPNCAVYPSLPGAHLADPEDVEVFARRTMIVWAYYRLGQYPPNFGRWVMEGRPEDDPGRQPMPAGV